MARLKSPLCFVAMAFGKKDTDSFYDNLLLPTLKRNNIRPVIINRRQSNDDLNIQIIEQLRLADICIVDLTYARPSVYFEAGVAQQRGIPVIYTARSDHFKNGQPDDLRIHFDLTMKPIIEWDGINDKTFSSRIDKRLKSTFLNNWNQGQKASQKYIEANEAFQKLPIIVRSLAIRQETIKLLKYSGFYYWGVYEYFNGHNINSQTQILKSRIYQGAFNHVFGHKIVNKKLYYASVHSYTSPQKSDLEFMQMKLTSRTSFKGITENLIEKKNIKQVVITSFVLSLNNVTSSRIENTLQSIILSDTGDYYQDLKGSRTAYNDRVNVDVNFVFLSGIKSTLELKENLIPLVKNLFGVTKKK